MGVGVWIVRPFRCAEAAVLILLEPPVVLAAAGVCVYGCDAVVTLIDAFEERIESLFVFLFEISLR